MKILSDLPRNAKYPILLEPMYSIFGGVILFYLPLYMKEIGVSEVEMGIVNTCNIFLSFVFFFFAGTITNKLGRRKTTFIFDVISWTIPMFLWAVAQNLWYFLAAAVINSAVKVVFVSWNCLVTEDTPPDKRAKVFGLLYIIIYVCGLTTPVAGMIIARHGTVPTMRIIYALGLVSMTAAFIIRNALVRETAAGRAMMEKHNGVSIARGISNYLSSVRNMAKNRSLILITAVFVISNFIIQLNFFQVLFLTDFLGFGEFTVSMVPGIGALINIMLYVFILPRLGKFSEEFILTISVSIAAVGAFMFILIPKGNLFYLIPIISIIAVGNFMLQTFRDSILMNRTDEHGKADTYAAVQTLTSLLCIPAGYIGGLTYSMNPLIPFVIILILSFMLVPITIAIRKK